MNTTNEKIYVYFGYSFLNPEVVYIMEQGEPVEFFEVDEEKFPVYNSDVESWLARTDMNFSKFLIDKNQLDFLSKKYEEFVHTASNKEISDETVNKLKEEFLQLVKQ